MVKLKYIKIFFIKDGLDECNTNDRKVPPDDGE